MLQVFAGFPHATITAAQGRNDLRASIMAKHLSRQTGKQISKHLRSSRLVKKRGKKVGASPGTLVHVGEASTAETQMRLISYNQDELQDHLVESAADCRRPEPSKRTCWFNIEGVHEIAVIQTLGTNFGLHALVMEDILNTDHRPKVENHDDYLYIVLKMLQYDEEAAETRTEQLSLIVGNNYVLAFQERSGDVFDGVRKRLSSGRSIRQRGPDYLAYALIDAIVDNYFVLLERFGDEVELLEEELLNNPTPRTLSRIHHFKREMLLLRKAVWPLREVLSSLTRDESRLISAETRLFLRDVYDHTIHIIDTIETIRDLLSGMLDLYVSSVSNRMNEIMKVLTIFASVFMPLTFIAGVYGMNFRYMPELALPWAYPATLLLMLGVAVGLMSFFRWKKWL
jgi:magnesium transporter